jgi:integrase
MAKGLNKLSDRQVRTAKAGMHGDGGNLWLQVTAGKSGQLHRSWLFRYATGEVTASKSGKARKVERVMGLGPLDSVSLATARRKAADARALIATGQDPIQVRDDRRAAQAALAARAMTFDQCCDGYVADHERGWTARHKRVWGNSIRDHVSPVFGKLPVAMVETPLVLRAVKPIWATKHPTAKNVRERIECVIDWAVAHHYREAGPNPARWRGCLDQVLAKPADIHLVEHHRAMDYREAGKLLAELVARDDRDARCLTLLFLTAVRVGAAVGARAEEFDLAAKIWTVPPMRMKRRGKRKAVPFRVPLSDAAIALIERVGVKTGLLFPGATDKSLAAAHGRTDITTHGLRSTFRDWSAEQTAFPREVIEMAMGHVVGDETEEAYFRSDLFEKRRKLMDAWLDYCNAPPADASNKIMPIRQAG